MEAAKTQRVEIREAKAGFLSELNAKVNDLLSNGYELHGAVITREVGSGFAAYTDYGVMYTQFLIKKFDNDFT